MSSDDLLMVFIFILIGIIVMLGMIIVFVKNEKIECYEDYMQKGIIATRCEKHFKDLKLGSDNNE